MSLSATLPCFLNISRDSDSLTSLSVCSFWFIQSKKFVLVCKLNLPLHSLSPLPRSISSYLGEKTNLYLAKASFQVDVESYKVSPEASLLQNKNGPGRKKNNREYTSSEKTESMLLLYWKKKKQDESSDICYMDKLMREECKGIEKTRLRHK